MEILPIGTPASTIPSSAALPPDRNIVVPEAGGKSAPVAAPVLPNAAIQQPSPAASSEQVKQAVKDINKALQEQGRSLEFEIDPESKEPIVKVVDLETQQVIRQMPTKDALDIARALDRLQSLLVHQKA